MRREDPWLKEQIHERTLPNGLKAFVIPKRGFQKKFATFGVHYGSLDSRFLRAATSEPVQVPDGIAHFLEHKLFEEEDGNVAERFSALGASSNAYTNYVSTMYLFSTTERWHEALALLLSFVQRPHITPENVLKEQGIIDQELRMYMDDPHWRVFHNLLAAVYQEHPVRIDIGGTPESIARITADDLLLCYRSFYTPRNMTFVAVGDLDPEATLDEVQAQLEGFDGGEVPKRLFAEEPTGVADRRVEAAMPLNRPLFEMAFKEAAAGGGDSLRREITTGLLLEVLFGPSSAAYNALYEEGLINEQFGTQYFAGRGFGLTLLGGETADPTQLTERILQTVRLAKKDGIDTQALERARRKGIGEFIGLFDSPEAIAHSFSECHFKGQDLFAFLPLLQDITREEMMERLESHFTEDNWAVSIVRPEA